eukprot:gnl/TRDRNA2_/TRDRNA2_187008_c0_seq1.p1 gnl/TRDRNA2_/TRDRNA2_187008_c0~~gnl/TRDRNA2_/TRDRNA2_187008_c0_seq1.p1  ORF type:complete len:103 (+),score=24.17 gnl/TRDRNA2_/TRDRNA2_187008_c0_seq1:168-476(+)
MAKKKWNERSARKRSSSAPPPITCAEPVIVDDKTLKLNLNDCDFEDLSTEASESCVNYDQNGAPPAVVPHVAGKAAARARLCSVMQKLKAVKPSWRRTRESL